MDQHDRIDLTITGGNFTTIHGGSYYHNVHNVPQESGILALSQAIEASAMYDSAMRYPAGKCHPGTRENIIKSILEWVNSPVLSSSVLWLCGSAGSGKSAIMHTIAEKLHESNKERYGGSFFFARGVRGRDEGIVLFTTLAYQLATNFPDLREPINRAIAVDLTLPTKSMQVQLKSLVVEPLKHCSGLSSHPPTLIIDGLDECGNSRTQREILSLIADAITVTHVPLRFLVASRPEFWIRETIERPPLCHITQQLNISDEEHKSDAYQDVKNYLQAGFDDIYERNLDLMGHIERPWPSEELLNRLAYHASGQFIYASTILKFVGEDSDFTDPQMQLDILSNPGPLQASVFSDLDRLYTTILSVYPRRDTLIRVLGCLLLDMPPTAIRFCLGINVTEFNLVLRAISSLTRVSKLHCKSDGPEIDLIYRTNQDQIKFCHLSFRQFLEDKTRSGCFSIDIHAFAETLFTHTHDLFIGSILNGTCNPRDLILSTEDILIHTFVALGGKVSSATFKRFLDHLRSVLQEFGGNRSLIHTPFLLRLMSDLRFVFQELTKWGKHKPIISPDEIVKTFEAPIDGCVEKILSENRLPVLEDIVYLVGHRYSYGGNLDEISLLPQFSRERATLFLAHNVHLTFCTFVETDRAVGFIRHYRLEGSIYSFLSSESRGGRFHHEFRRHFIRISRYFLAFLLDTCESDGSHHKSAQWKLANSVFREFLTNRPISDLRPMEDTETITNFQELIESLCAGNNYERLDNFRLYQMLDIVEWLHRQLCQHASLLLIEEKSSRDLKQEMINTVEQICKTFIVSKFQVPFYSDNEEEEKTWLSNLRFPPPYTEHLPGRESIAMPYNIKFSSARSTCYRAGAGITAILEDGAVVYPHIDLTQVYTHLLELYLIDFSTQIELRARSESCIYPAGSSFASWFGVADPTEKIQVGLWTLHYLCSKERLPWRPPAGFCLGAMDFLEKYELDQQGELTRWLEDLIQRQLCVDSFRDWFGTPLWLVAQGS